MGVYRLKNGEKVVVSNVLYKRSGVMLVLKGHRKVSTYMSMFHDIPNVGDEMEWKYDGLSDNVMFYSLSNEEINLNFYKEVN